MNLKALFAYSILLLTCCLAACSDDGGSTPDATVVVPDVLANEAAFLEGNENIEYLYSINLSTATTATVVVNYETLDNTARAGNDYEPISNGQVVFAPGETQQDIALTIIGEAFIEGDETFKILFTQVANATLATEEVLITITNDDQPRELTIPQTGYSTPDAYDGMNLVWQDEFSDPQLNIQDWTYELGDGCPNLCGWGNGELEYYRIQNTSIKEGSLVISAQKENVGGKNYTSSRLITKGAKSFKYGRVDIRAALPYGKGLWPALWMLGSNIDDVGWPSCGEIDIMELIGGDSGNNADNKVYGTVHWNNNGSNANFGQSYTLPTGDFSDEFHVFSIVWDENSIQWFVDDIKYNEVDITPSALSEFQEEFFFVFNVAVGGAWPGSPNASTQFPQYMIVDYIRVFQPI